MDQPFDIAYFPSALDEFRDLFHRAKKVGLGQQVLDAGKEIDERLRSDPIKFGDPLYPLRGLNLQLFGRAISPVFVNYAVHFDKRVVFVSSFKAAPGVEF